MEEYHPPLIWVTDTKFSSSHYTNFSINFDIHSIVKNHPSAIILHTGNINITEPDKYKCLSGLDTRDSFYTLYYIYGLTDFCGKLELYENDDWCYKTHNSAGLRARNFIKLNSKTLLIGIEGFPDAGYQEIKDTNSCDYISMLFLSSNYSIEKSILKYSYRDAEILKKKLDYIIDNLNNIQCLLIALHICPFLEPFSDSKLSEYNDKIGINSSKVLGNILLKFSEQYPNISIQILCGIPASEPFSYKINKNITIYFTISYSKTKQFQYININPSITLSKISNNKSMSNKEVTSNNELMLNNELISNNGSMLNNELISNNESMLNKEIISNNEVTSNNESMLNSELISGDELRSNKEVISNNEMISGDELRSNELSRIISIEEPIKITNVYPEMNFDKIIFLDIDGVINTNIKQQELTDDDIYHLYKDDLIYNQFHINGPRLALTKIYNYWRIESIKVLQQICKNSNVKIVITSYWRMKYMYEEMRFFFDIFDLGKYIIGFTSEHYDLRGEEIRHYLIKHPNIKNFVIIDDMDAGISRIYPNNFVKIEGFLSMDHFDIIKKHLDI